MFGLVRVLFFLATWCVAHVVHRVKARYVQLYGVLRGWFGGLVIKDLALGIYSIE